MAKPTGEYVGQVTPFLMIQLQPLHPAVNRLSQAQIARRILISQLG